MSILCISKHESFVRYVVGKYFLLVPGLSFYSLSLLESKSFDFHEVPFIDACCVCESVVWLSVTPRTAAHRAPLSGGSPGRTLQWVALPSFKGSCQPGGQTEVSLHCRQILHHPSHRRSHLSSVNRAFVSCSPGCDPEGFPLCWTFMFWASSV